MAGTYSLEQIRDSILTERFAGKGLSPVVTEQNKLIARLIAVGAKMEAPAILGCQILGSRAYGAARPTSDLDMAIITYDNDTRKPAGNLAARLQHALLPAGIQVDAGMAAGVLRILSRVPAGPVKFIRQISSGPQQSVGLYETGVYDTPGLRLGALAANEVIRAKGPADAPRVWEAVRTHHARAYIGLHTNFCTKVAQVMDLHPYDVAAVVTPEVWQERTEKFGLPSSFDDHYQAGQDWLAAQSDIPQDYAPGVALYEQVHDLLPR